MKIIEVIIKFITLARLGLAFNIIGTIMIAFSFGKNLGEAYQKDSKGQRIYLASFLYPKLFRFGLIFIIFGFFLQLIG